MPPFIAQNQARILPQRNIDVSGFAALIKAKRDKQLAEEQDQVSSQILQQGFQDPKGAAVEAFKTGDRGLAGLMLKQHQAKIAAQQPQRVKQTALVQNLLAAGLKPGTPEFKNAILGGTKRHGTVVNNVLPGAQKGANKLNEKFAEQGAGLIERADSALDMANKYSQLAQLADSPDIRTGSLGEFEHGLKKFAHTVLGMDVKGVAEGEHIKKIQGEMLGLQRKLVGDKVMSDADRKAYMLVLPGLTNSAKGIALSAKITNKLANGLAQTRQHYLNLVKENGGYPDVNVQIKLNKYIRDNPILTPDDVNEARESANKTKQNKPGAGMGKLLNKYGIE